MTPVVRVGTVAAPDGPVLHFRADGAGPIALIASNGIGVSTFFWRKLAGHFARETWVPPGPTSAAGPPDRTHTFITWDYRGHGHSPVPEDAENLTVALCARDLFTVLDAVGFERAVLLGHSMGCQVMFEAYRQKPERVQALIPMLGAPGKIFSSFLGGAALEPVARLFIELGASNARLAEQALHTVVRLPGVWEATRALGFVHPDLCPKEAFEPYFEHLAELDLRGYFALARDLLSHDASDLLPQIRVPTLVVAGERDLFTPVQRSREMAAQIPGAELLLLRQGSHAALVEQPELVALSVEKFLKLHGLAPGDAQQAVKKN